ncbi:acyltransferase family protein [Pseudomonas sp. UFMG81]|uniref:acyltransferase family protein n=1 Tax=Pseudomonas sp. UFMG81 TaxID=2745936 RepID=UPI002B26CAA9|nr:acyltransferase family protein [Pseudomonas sp. UFMG81]
MDYRADIDGLRAVAVMLVIVFHGGLTLFPSGFIGVDIFFVISGYLTSSIILSGMQKGTFTFSGFYARRIWRLQPAVLALLVVTLAVATYVYLPIEYVSFLKSEKYTSLLLSNQHFIKVSDGYATPDSATRLLLHTWSLAIEWQWYIVLPVGLWLLNRSLSRRQLGYVCVVLTLLAIGAAFYVVKTAEGLGYYYFTARIFELMIGSCVAVLGRDRKLPGQAAATLIALAAILAIVYVALQTIPATAYPDYRAVLVCVATAALLYVGPTSLTSSVLSARPVVLIGLMSYSLYLWHWPIMATITYLGLEKTPAVIATYFVATFVLASLSYALVEKPLRKSRMSFAKTLAIMVVVPALAFSALHDAGKAADGWPQRFGFGADNALSRLKAAEVPHREKCLDVSDGKDPGCILGDVKSKTTALLMGDSFSNHEWRFIDILAKDANVSVLAQSYPACLTLPGIYMYDWLKFQALYSKCHAATADYYAMIRNNHYKYVMIGQVWERYVESDKVVTALEDERTLELSHQRMQDALLEGLKLITESGAIPVIIKANLKMPDAVNDCVYRNIKLRGLFGSETASEQCATQDWDGQEHPALTAMFKAAKAAYPQLIFIDPKDAQCENGSCLTAIDGLPVYRDIGHVTDYASHKLGVKYLQEMGNPFKAPTH